MKGTLDTPSIVICHSRIKHGLWFMATAIVAAGGARLLIGDSEANPAATWLLAALCTPMAVVAFAFILSPARLILDKSGATVEMLWKRWRFAWNDFDAFEIANIGRYRCNVFELAASCPPDRGDTFVASLRSFGPMWEMDQQSLVRLLRAAKKRWGDANGPIAVDAGNGQALDVSVVDQGTAGV